MNQPKGISDDLVRSIKDINPNLDTDEILQADNFLKFLGAPGVVNFWHSLEYSALRICAINEDSIFCAIATAFMVGYALKQVEVEDVKELANATRH